MKLLLEEVKHKIKLKLQELDGDGNLKVFKKHDGSQLTNLDIYISNLIRDLIKDSFKNKYTFFSEEEYEKLDYPAVILDPIDGTKEFIKGIPEWAVSLAVAENSELEGFAWIYNPLKEIEVSSENLTKIIGSNADKLVGFVSRTEHEKGLFPTTENQNITLKPMGSIAFKLALLARGECDFVLSLRPKNIWDVAAGTMLCAKQGIFLYHGKSIVRDFTSVRMGPPLLWCRPEKLDFLYHNLIL